MASLTASNPILPSSKNKQPLQFIPQISNLVTFSYSHSLPNTPYLLSTKPDMVDILAWVRLLGDLRVVITLVNKIEKVGWCMGYFN